MFMFFLMKGKGGKKAFQYKDNNPTLEQQSKARTGNRCSWITQALLRPPNGSRAKSTYRPQGYPFP